MEKILAVCDVCGNEEYVYCLEDGRKVCEDCLSSVGMAKCYDCGEIFPVDEMTESGYGDIVCQRCIDENYILCEDCGNYYYEYDTHEVHTGRRSWQTMNVCDDCLDNSRYYCCDDCGEWYDDYEMERTEVSGGYEVCPHCLENNYFFCEECQTYHSNDDMVWNDFDDPVCEDCYNSTVIDNKVIHRYTYKPRPQFRTHYASNGRVYEATDISDFTFGVELEVDRDDYDTYARDDAIREIGDCSDDVYMKEDASIRKGYEVVTQPCTLEYHMNDLKWREICQISKSHGFKSHDARTCGLHVHVGRYQLGSDCTERYNTIANVLLMIDRHWDMLVKFSRRKMHQLEHYAARPQIMSYKPTDSDEDIRAKMWVADNHWRYQALNLDNDNTIEFRLFNGTLKRDTIIATLQLVWNICMYAKTHTLRECMASTWENITQYKEFDELNTYLRERSLVHDATDHDATDSDELSDTLTPPDADELYDAWDSEESDPDVAPADAITIGTQVRLTREFEGAPAGMVGTVMAVRDHLREYRYGVMFPEYRAGHSLDGILSDANSSHGWWVNQGYLALAS